MTYQDQPRVLGIRATVWVTGLALALVSGAGVGAWRGGLLSAPADGRVINPTEVAASPTKTPALIQPPGVRRVASPAPAVVVTATDTPAVSEPATASSAPFTTTGARAVTQPATPAKAGVQPARTDCPDGMIPDENGGCVVDHGNPAPSSGEPQKGGGGKANGAGQGGGPPSSSGGKPPAPRP